MGIGAIVANVAKAAKRVAEEVAERAQGERAFPRAVDVAAGPSQPRVIPANYPTDPVEDTPSVTDDVKAGKSLQQIGSERGLTYAETVAQLRAEGFDVQTTDPSGGNGDVQTTVIRDPVTGEVITEYYDFQHDTYTTEQQRPDGTQIHSPMRDGSGRRIATSHDETTGATTTRYEDDLGDGQVVERTRLPDGTVMEKVTPAGGQPTTTVTVPDGEATVLADSQVPTRAGAQPLVDAVAQGKTIDQIARESGLTQAQVIAQLHAAGYTVTFLQPTSDNGSVAGTRVTDGRTDAVVAAHYHDQEHDMRTTQHVDAHGNTVFRSTESDGTVTVRVQAPGGRETVTVTGPDGTTTIRESFNGHTLTTAPDGALTLTNNTTGIKITIQPGTPEASLVRLFMDADPNSSDPAKASEGEVITAIVGQMLAGKQLPEAITAATEAGQHTQDMIEQYPEMWSATPTQDETNGVQDPIGEPPPGYAPSGDKWVPVLVDGSWRWVDPNVAEAMYAESVATAEANALSAQIGQYQALLDVYALDPAYADALDGAQGKINDALEPHELHLTLEQPAGTLEDARNRLTAANNQLTQANGALSQYRTAQITLETAIDRWDDVQALRDTSRPSIDAADSPPVNWNVENARRLAEQIEVKGLFSRAGEQQAQADQLTIDLLIAQTGATTAPEGVEMVDITVGDRTIKVTPEVAADYERHGVGALLAGDQPIGIQITVPDGQGGTTQEWRWVDPAYAIGKLQADRNVELAGANNNFFTAYAESTDWETGSQDLQARLLAEYNADNPHLFEEGREHFRIKGDHLGTYQGQRLEIREGNQVWVVVEFEKGTTETQLTVGPDDTGYTSEYRDRPLNQEWQELLAGTRDNSSSCDPYGGLEGMKVDAVEAGRALTALQNDQLTMDLAELDDRIGLLSGDLTAAIEAEGPGTAELPAGTFPDGQEPVEIEVGGTPIRVAPDVAERYETMGLDALLQSSQPIYIMLDLTPGDDDTSKQGRWVNPEVAVAQIRLDAARAEQEAKQTLQTALVTTSNWYDMVLSQPDLLLDSAPDEDFSRITEQERLALEGMYQPQFQALLDNDSTGLFTEFRSMDGEKLDEIVAGTFGPHATGKVMDEILEVGGEAPQVRMVPMFLVDPTHGTQQVALIAVQDKNDPGKTWYVDATGRRFTSLEEFQDNNSMFSPDAKLVVPVGLDMQAGSDGRIALDVVNARNLSVQERIVDPVVGITTSVLTVASFGLPVLAPFALAGGAYLGARAIQRQHEYIQTGGEWGDRESVMNMGMAVTTFLPYGSVGFRTVGMMRNLGLSFPRATLAGMGGMRTTGAVNAAAGASGPSRLWHTVPHMREVGPYLGTAGGLNRAAHVTDAGAMAVGAPLMADGAYNLIVHGDEMNGLQLVEAVTGTLTGFVGTGLGARGLTAHFQADRGHFVQLQGADGQTIKAFVQGDPLTPDLIYVPPRDVTAVRMDDPAVTGRTHTVVQDSETGQHFVLPLKFRPNPRGANPDVAARRPNLNYLADGAVTVGGRPVDPAMIEMAVSPNAILVIARGSDMPPLDRLITDITGQPTYRPGQDVVLFACGAGTRTDTGSPIPSSYARDLANRLGSRVSAVDGDVVLGETVALGGPVRTERPSLPLIDISGGEWRPQENYGAQQAFWLGEGGPGRPLAAPFGDTAQGARVDGQPIDPLHLNSDSNGTYLFRNGRWYDARTGAPVNLRSRLNESGTGQTTEGAEPPRHHSGPDRRAELRGRANDVHNHHGGLNEGGYALVRDVGSSPSGIQTLLSITGKNGDPEVGPRILIQRVPQSVVEQAGYYLGRVSETDLSVAEFTIYHYSDGTFEIRQPLEYFSGENRTIPAGRFRLGEGGFSWEGGALPAPPPSGAPPREYQVNIIPDLQLTYRGPQRDVGLMSEVLDVRGGANRILIGLVAGDPADPMNVRQLLGSLNYANQHEQRPGQLQIIGVGEWTLSKEGVIVNVEFKPDLHRPEAIDQLLHIVGEMGGVVIVHTDAGNPNMIKGPTGERLLIHAPSDYANVDPLLNIFRRHPKTKIVWAHAGGLSRSGRPSQAHARMIQEKVLEAPDLTHVSIDMSWDVVANYIVDNERSMREWAAVMNERPDRFIHGSDSLGASQAKTQFAALDTYMDAGFLKMLGAENTLEFLEHNFNRLFLPALESVTKWRLANAETLRQYPWENPGEARSPDPFGPRGPFDPIGPTEGVLWTPGSEGRPASTLWLPGGETLQPRSTEAGESRAVDDGNSPDGHLNYLGDGVVTVNGERVSADALNVAAPPGSFLVIARGDGAGGLLDPTGNPLSMDKLADDLAGNGYRPGQDVVLWICGAGARNATSDSPVTRSVAQDLADRLGARVHAVDGDIVVGETVDLSGRVVTERPGLPLADISTGVWHPQQNFDAQHAFWVDGRRGVPVAEPFADPPLTYIRPEDGSLDPLHLGVGPDHFNPLIDGSPATASNSAAFALRGALIIVKKIYGDKIPSLDADRPLGMLLRGGFLTTYLVNDTVVTQWIRNGGLTNIDPNQPIALQIMEKAFILGFGAGNTLLTGTAAVELVGGARKKNWDRRTTQGVRATGMSLLAAAAPLWTTHTGARALEQFASGHPVTGTALTAATLMEGIFTYSMTRASLDEWAKVRKDPHLGGRKLTRLHVMLGGALFFATGIQFGLELYKLMSKDRGQQPMGPRISPTPAPGPSPTPEPAPGPRPSPRSAPGSSPSPTPDTSVPASPTPVPTSSVPSPVQTTSLSPAPGGGPQPYSG